MLLVLGVVTFIAAMLNFEALKEGKLSVVDVILELELPVTAVLGVVIFGEIITISQFAAMAVIFAGIVLISLRKSDLKRHHSAWEKGVVLAIFAGVGMGLVNFMTAASSKQISPLMAIWFPWLVYGLISIFVILWKGEGRKLCSNARRYKWIVLLMVFFDTAAWLFYALATSHNAIAVTTAITESYPALAMVLGVTFNKERMEKHQYLGASLALVASVGLAMLI